MERFGDWMQSNYGNKIYPLDPNPDEIHIEDITNCLSKICRYAGHTNEFYSVAEHSTIMARVFPEHAKIALLHDAAEAYFGDLPRPIKSMIPEFKKYEHKMLNCIFEKFNVGTTVEESADIIEEMDIYMLAMEFYSPKVMYNPKVLAPWECIADISPPFNLIRGLPSQAAKDVLESMISKKFNLTFK